MAVNQSNLEQSIKDAFDSAFTALTHAEPTITVDPSTSVITTTYAEVSNTVGPDVEDMRDAIAKAVSIEVLNHVQLLTTAPTGATTHQSDSAIVDYLETFEAESQIIALKDAVSSFASSVDSAATTLASVVPVPVPMDGGAVVSTQFIAGHVALAASITAAKALLDIALAAIVTGTADGVQ